MNRYGKERLPIPTPGRLIQELRLRKPPAWMIYIAIIAVAASWLPIAMALYARASIGENPRPRLIQDMGSQPKYKPQQASIVFEDGRAMRPPVPGAVAQGDLRLDDHYYRGYTLVTDAQADDEADHNQAGQAIEYFPGLPDRVELTEAYLRRGQQRYNIFCAPCHGLDGRGEGPVHLRALAIGEVWTQPSNLHTIDPTTGKPQFGSELYADGRLFNIITNGVRSMPSYSRQISVDDRWAIVAYVRALQRSQHTTMDDVPASKRDQVREMAPVQ